MPLTVDARFMAFRLLASVPNTVFQTLLYLRLRRLLPFALAHALLDGATALIPYYEPQCLVIAGSESVGLRSSRPVLLWLRAYAA